MHLLVIFAFLQLVFSEKMPLPELYSYYDIALTACSEEIAVYALVCEGDSEEAPYACFCPTDGAFTTIVDCFVKGYDNNTHYLEEFIAGCASEGNTTMNMDQMWSRYHKNIGNMKNVSQVEGFNLTKPFDEPVLLDYNIFKINKKYALVNELNENYSQYFGYSLMGFWVFVLFIAAIVNWTIELFPSFTNKFAGPLSNRYRKFITLSAAYRKNKSNAYKFGFLVPSRMESIIIFSFTLLTAIFCGIGITPVPGNTMYPSMVGFVAKLIAIRTGIMVGFVLPLLVLFAGRNNFLQWLTRWNFATFITYHRWVSRIVALLVIIHAITFTISDLTKGSYTRHMSRDFVQWGVVAGVGGGIILVQGLLFARRKSYEVFLIIHILMALFFIVGGYKHTVEFGYAPYYWATVAVWALDRAIRFSRLIVFGAPKAQVTLLADETLRVVIPKPSYWHAIPGGHAFIHFLKPSCFWQSHPFTFTDSSEEGNYIVMYIKLKGGVTHGVYKHLSQRPGKSAPIRVLVEGPYGEASSARKYKNVVFIAGGNGIPGIYSECMDLARKTANGNGPRLKLMWIIREWKSLAWFFHELKNIDQTNIDATIFITKPQLNLENGLSHLKPILNDSDSSNSVTLEHEFAESKDKEKSEYGSDDLEGNRLDDLVSIVKAELSHIKFVEHRPEMSDLVVSEIEQTDGSLAFVTCGHPVMVDDIRYEVSHNLDKSSHRIEYFEQLQVWA